MCSSCSVLYCADIAFALLQRCIVHKWKETLSLPRRHAAAPSGARGRGHHLWEGSRGSAQSRARALYRICCWETSRCRDFIQFVILFYLLINTPTLPNRQHARDSSPAGGTVRQPDRSQGEWKTIITIIFIISITIIFIIIMKEKTHTHTIYIYIYSVWKLSGKNIYIFNNQLCVWLCLCWVGVTLPELKLHTNTDFSHILIKPKAPSLLYQVTKKKFSEA